MIYYVSKTLTHASSRFERGGMSVSVVSWGSDLNKNRGNFCGFSLRISVQRTPRMLDGSRSFEKLSTKDEREETNMTKLFILGNGKSILKQ